MKDIIKDYHEYCMKVDEWQDRPCTKKSCENGCNCECPSFGFNLMNYSIDDQMKLFNHEAS